MNFFAPQDEVSRRMEQNFFSGLEIYFKALEIYFSGSEIYFQATEKVLCRGAEDFVPQGEAIASKGFRNCPPETTAPRKAGRNPQAVPQGKSPQQRNNPKKCAF